MPLVLVVLKSGSSSSSSSSRSSSSGSNSSSSSSRSCSSGSSSRVAEAVETIVCNFMLTGKSVVEVEGSERESTAHSVACSIDRVCVSELGS